MLLEDFYSVSASKFIDESSLEFTVELHKEHPVFKGHFPNYPVTPGVAMIQIIKNQLETVLQYQLQLKSGASIKFLNLVNPLEETTLVFNLQYTIETDEVKVKNSTSFKDGRPVLKCNVTFVKK